MKKKKLKRQRIFFLIFWQSATFNAWGSWRNQNFNAWKWWSIL